ncbi:MAG: PilZ domain-containing protein [Elusimicrobiota bacterium]
MATKDSRKKSRVPIHIPVLLCTDPQGRRVKGNAVVMDLSSEGLGFETEAELRRGDLLFLKLFLPVSFACNVSNIKAAGENFRCGAKIQRIGFLDKLKLRDFLKKQLTAGATKAIPAQKETAHETR